MAVAMATNCAWGQTAERKTAEEVYKNVTALKGTPAEDLVSGIRVVTIRTGLVLSSKGGVLQRLLIPFRLGLGGRTASGSQYMSWITLDDVIGIIQHALATESLSGPVNTVAPNPVTNAQFIRTLGEILHRPTIFPLPAFVVRLMFGEMGEALLLSSQRVDCGKLLSSGYRFLHPELKPGLEAML